MGIDIDRIVAESAPPERVNVRKEAESEARQLLEAGATSWSEEDAKSFFDLLDRDFYDGVVKQTRFGLAFRGNNRRRMLSQREALLPILDKLYRTPVPEIESTIDEALAISGAGRAIVSMVLYLRDREAFACWGPRMVEGVGRLAGGDLRSPKTGRGYLDYNSAAQKVRAEYGIEPEAFDAVVWQVAEEAGAVKSGPGDGVDLEEAAPFLSARSFELLAELAKQPDKAFYKLHRDDLKELVVAPIQKLLLESARLLPVRMKQILETETHLFGSILKNDFGQGGAWPFYWGALHPTGTKKTDGAQLFVWVNAEVLDIGFAIGQNGEESQTRFSANCSAFEESVRECLEAHPRFPELSFGGGAGDDQPRVQGGPSFDEWIADPKDPRAGIALRKEVVIAMSFEELRDRVVETFLMLYPLVLLAMYDDPAERLAEVVPPIEPPKPTYSLDEVSAATGINKEILGRWVRSIGRKGQAVFYGPPGTGKTFIAEHLARHLIGGGRGFVDIVQFHPAYAYEDFMQGIRPQTRADGSLEYRMEAGRFRDFCERAETTNGKCVLIVDEINRANLSRVFGELMYLLEYRTRAVPLAGGGAFKIPDNVFLIGTMNTADRSIALVDHALRRRFAFIPLRPDHDVLSQYLLSYDFPPAGLISVLKEINDTIGDANYAVGISFFMRKDLESEIEDIWCMEIEPYLEEYFYGQSDKVDRFRWNKVYTKILA